MTAFRSSTALALALSAGLLTGPALSQARWVEVSDNTPLGAWNMSADAVEDLDVMGANGQKIGDVEEVIGTDNATPTALVVDFDENAGFGARDDVMVPLANFTPGATMLTLTSDASAVEGMETWND